MISFSFSGFMSCAFTVLMSVMSTRRASLPRLPRHRHHQGDPTADCLPQHQQDQCGLRVGAPSSGRAWKRRPQGQPGAITWPEHPVAGAASRPGQRRAGADDPGAVQVPGGEPAGGGGALHEEKSMGRGMEEEEWLHLVFNHTAKSQHDIFQSVQAHSASVYQSLLAVCIDLNPLVKAFPGTAILIFQRRPFRGSID